MTIDLTDKELQIIQLIVPDMTPDQACAKVLRDWMNANLNQLTPTTSSAAQIDVILTAHATKVATPTV